MFKPILLPLFLIGILAGGVYAVRATGSEDSVNYPELRNFSLPDTNGELQSIDQWRNKVLVINFWATWCEPCRKEIPLFMDLQKTYRNQDLQFVGIAIDETNAVREFTDRQQINYPSLIAGMAGMSLSASLGNLVGVVPFTVVVNREGRIVHTQPGMFHIKQFRALVLPLLQSGNQKTSENPSNVQEVLPI
ncbi:MAG: TlpA disulfide reductase family protein [Pseudomonadota bacterium]|nr:TlpA disulfide reductase family protein [Pseudomonadota bacterium]